MSNGMDQIEHIVYLMLENRAIDNVLGWLYDDTGNKPKYVIPPQSPPLYFGLEENTYFNKDAQGNKHYVVKGTGGMNVPSWDPYEEYEHINNQLFETMDTPPPSTPPTMGGFYKDFATSWDSPEQIMQTYTRQQLPVINGLARNFAVSDMYFASVPTQTNCNRAFAATGNSLGLDDQKRLIGWVNNHFGPWWNPKQLVVTFNQRTLWNVLNDNGHGSPGDWMIFYSEIWTNFCFTRDMLNQIQDRSLDAHFSTIQQFYQRAQQGSLPTFSFLEPEWGLMKGPFGWNGNDYHPPCNLGPGEVFLNKIYQALTSNAAAWQKTLFIINFDEHGGTYDHFPPLWGATPPWGEGTPNPSGTEMNFLFNRFGVRVPLILVSPYVQPSTVFRASAQTPFDHTSVIATILNKFGVPRDQWKLGNRTFQAPTFEGVLTLDSPRTDVPNFTPIAPEAPVADVPYTSFQLGIAHRVLMHAAKGKANTAGIRSAYDKHFANVKTIAQLSRALTNMLQDVQAMR